MKDFERYISYYVTTRRSNRGNRDSETMETEERARVTNHSYGSDEDHKKTLRGPRIVKQATVKKS